MSAYKRIQCSIVDKEALIEAIKEMGLTPTVHDTPQSLYGFRGDQRDQKADIIVNRHQINRVFTGASNDLGFRFDEESGEYIMMCSDYDQACQIDQRVKQAYAKVVIEKALRSQGFKVKVTMPEDVSLRSRKRSKINVQGRKVV